MNKVDEIRSWPKNSDGWYVSPGVDWCAEGNKVMLRGDRVTIGNGVKLGDWVTLGDEVKLGDGVKLSNWVKLGDWVKLSKGVKLGDGVELGDGVKLGDRVIVGRGSILSDDVKLGHGAVIGDRVLLSKGVKLGDNVNLGNSISIVSGTTFARDLGVQSNYRHALTIVDGELRFVGGCHTFSFAEARKYWAGKHNRIETLAAIDFAETLAKLIPETAAILNTETTI